MTRRQITLLTIVFASSLLLLATKSYWLKTQKTTIAKPLKLYWFIPDGLRAEPELFNIFQWAREGKLPNIKKMMEEGSYGYSIPSFPGHTPVNFATLLSGQKPKDHGVTDGPIRLPGYHVKRVSASGFRSSTRRVDAVWNILEKNNIHSTILSVPGSTPPDADDAYIFKGRWGGWGVELPALIFQSQSNDPDDEEAFKRSLHFEFGQRMTHFIKAQQPKGWDKEILNKVGNSAYEVELNAYENIFYGLIYEPVNGRYSKVLLSKDKKSILADLRETQWSNWIETDWSYRLKEDKNNFSPTKLDWEKELSKIHFNTWVRFKAIQLGEYGQFRIRFIKDDLNPYLTQPMDLDEKRRVKVGPFTDFPDNYPAQLIKVTEDKKTFQEEMEMSFESHQKMLRWVSEDLETEAIIHNIYSPNQMLTSRWWLGAIDPQSFRYSSYSDDEREKLKAEVLSMYQQVDHTLGLILNKKDKDTVIVLSSDHGIAPLNFEVRLNNLFAQKGWLHFIKDSTTGELKIDWDKTKAVYLKMYHIYLNPNGLGSSYNIQSDKKYLKFRTEVMDVLKGLKGPKGEIVLDDIKVREEAEQKDLESGRVGDILVSNKPPFNWSETFSEDKKIFVEPKISGFKQAVDPDKNKALWTPFVIVGPGVRKANELQKPIHHYEQLPIILKAMNMDLKKLDLPYLEGAKMVIVED